MGSKVSSKMAAPTARVIQVLLLMIFFKHSKPNCVKSNIMSNPAYFVVQIGRTLILARQT